MATEPDEASQLYQRIGHYIVEDRKVQNELTSAPLPFLDWGLVQPGFIAYVEQQTRNSVPLGKPHELTSPDQVEAVPVTVPVGVRIRAQPAALGGTFAEQIFEPKYPWEKDCTVHTLFHDDADQQYKLWYRTAEKKYAYAESADFKTWHRPLAPHVTYEEHTQTNIVGIIGGADAPVGDLRSIDKVTPGADGAYFVDPSAPPDQRYKCMFLGHVKPADTREYAKENGMELSAMTDPPSTVMFGAVSADGIGWRVLPKPIMLHDADTLTVPRYDTLLNRYVMYTRLYELGRRSVGFSETTDFARWPLPKNILSAGPVETPSVDFYATGFAYYPGRPEIRTMMLLVYDRFTDQSEIRLLVSRDGHTFHLVPGGPVIDADTAGRDQSRFLSAFPSLVRTPDGRMLVFFDASRIPHKFPRHAFSRTIQYAAWWKADRLAALEAPTEGSFVTQPLVLRGSKIVLNLQTERTGGIQVELRDEKFRPISGRTFADSDNLYGDEVAKTVTWNGDDNLSAHVNQTVHLRFRLRAAKLFSIAAVEQP